LNMENHCKKGGIPSLQMNNIWLQSLLSNKRARWLHIYQHLSNKQKNVYSSRVKHENRRTYETTLCGTHLRWTNRTCIGRICQKIYAMRSTVKLSCLSLTYTIPMIHTRCLLNRRYQST
jgi:hypothetical protein